MNYSEASIRSPQLFLSLVIMCLFDVGSSFSSGSVSLACSSGSPFHFPFSAQATPPPFAISAERNNRGSLFVTIYGLGEDVSFKGFLIKAYANDQIAGQFVSVPPEGQLINCGYPGGAASHASSDDKKAVTVEWVSVGYSGDITFSATVVQSYSRYWTNIKSSNTIDSIQN